MEVLKTVLIIYGILCIAIGLLKPPAIWNMGKFKALIKMMGKTGTQIFVLLWGAAALALGILL